MRTKLAYFFVVMQIAFGCFTITGSAQSEKNYNNSKVSKETLERRLIYKLNDAGFTYLDFVNENYCIGWDNDFFRILFIDLKEKTIKKYQCDEPLLYPSIVLSPDKKTCAIINETEYESNGVSQIKYVLYIVDVETSAVTKYEYPEFFDITAKAPHYKYDNIYAKKGEKIENFPLAIFWPNNKEIYIFGLSMWEIDTSTGKATHLMDDNYLEECQEQTDWMFRYAIWIIDAIQENVFYLHPDGLLKDREKINWDYLFFTPDGRSFQLPYTGILQGIYKDRYIVFEKLHDKTYESSIYDFDKKKFLETDGYSIFLSDKFIVALNQEKKKIYTHDGEKTQEACIPESALVGGWGHGIYTDSLFLSCTDQQAKFYYRYDVNSQQFSEVDENDIDFYCGGFSYGGGPSEWIDCEDGNTRRIFNNLSQDFYDLAWKR